MSGRHPYDLGWPDAYPGYDPDEAQPYDYTQDELDWLAQHDRQDAAAEQGAY